MPDREAPSGQTAEQDAIGSLRSIAEQEDEQEEWEGESRRSLAVFIERSSSYITGIFFERNKKKFTKI